MIGLLTLGGCFFVLVYFLATSWSGVREAKAARKFIVAQKEQTRQIIEALQSLTKTPPEVQEAQTPKLSIPKMTGEKFNFATQAWEPTYAE